MQLFLTGAIWMASILTTLPSVSGYTASTIASLRNVEDVKVLEYDAASASTKLEVAYAGADDADEALMFDLHIPPRQNARIWEVYNVSINGQQYEFPYYHDKREYLLKVEDNFSFIRTVALTVKSAVLSSGCENQICIPEQKDRTTMKVEVAITSIDGALIPHAGFGFVVKPGADHRLLSLFWNEGTDSIDLQALADTIISPSSSGDDMDDLEVPEMGATEDDFNLIDELEGLRLLEIKAASVQAVISEKKAAIKSHLKTERQKLCLKHLIKECDGVVCAAKAITQRICDKIGITLEPKYTEMQNASNQHILASNGTKTTTKPPLHPTDLVSPPNPLILALEILCSALGLTALIAFIKRRCMSERCRVDRAADREERKNARAYRRAARRALMRKRWDALVSCFHPRSSFSPRQTDYEEKRALIYQDALLEQDLDFAEKGQVMEAEIRELRHAHAIVSSLVRCDGTTSAETLHRYAVHDPPPPLVPLPYHLAASSTRSRAASTGTLPSYCSESLPDYTSRPEIARTESSARISRSSRSNSSSSVYPASSSSAGAEVPTSSMTSDSAGGDLRRHNDEAARRHFTPTSSVLDTSPRASEDTLRTSRRSREGY